MNKLKKEFMKIMKEEYGNNDAISEEKLWQWIEKQIKDAGAKGFKRGYKAGVERSVLSSMSDEQT
jgi:hypothetical protein